MQRVLFAIPHYFDHAGGAGARHDSARAASADKRAQALSQVIVTLHELFGQPQLLAQHSQRNCIEDAPPHLMHVDVAVATVGDNHLLDRLSCPPHLYERVNVNTDDPRWLGLGAHKIIAQFLGVHDWYVYLEDDTAIEDPLFFLKLRYAYDLLESRVGLDTLLQPARFETMRDASAPALPAPRKLYMDWECAGSPVFKGPDVAFEMIGRQWTLEPARHPHAGCFFLDRRRAEIFAKSPYCGAAPDLWITPPDTAATYSVMQTFRLYKPARDSLPFLEVRHLRPAMLPELRNVGPGTYTWTKLT